MPIAEYTRHFTHNEYEHVTNVSDLIDTLVSKIEELEAEVKEVAGARAFLREKTLLLTKLAAARAENADLRARLQRAERREKNK